MRFASINIERNKHLDRVIRFLKDFKPDILCMEEILECDLPLFAKELGTQYIFIPQAKVRTSLFDESTPLTTEGQAIFATVPLTNVRTFYYKGNEKTIPYHSKNEIGEETANFLLLLADAVIFGVTYTFITTHFIWTPNGQANEEQRACLRKIITFLPTVPHFVLAGDWNAPRGREIFDSLASRYKDNIPAHYITSIDKNLHKAGDLGLMVDGLFSTPEYEISDVKLTDGVSDHTAVTALIYRRTPYQYTN